MGERDVASFFFMRVSLSLPGVRRPLRLCISAHLIVVLDCKWYGTAGSDWHLHGPVDGSLVHRQTEATTTSTKHAAPGKRAAKVEFDPERAVRLLRWPVLCAGPALLTCSVRVRVRVRVRGECAQERGIERVAEE